MQTRIEERPQMIIVGMVSSGSDVRKINVNDLWEEFGYEKDQIKHLIPGKNYEIHIDDLTVDKHYCFVGIEVAKVEELPIQMFVKIIPAGMFVVFTHEFKDGEISKAYQQMSDWMVENGLTQAFPLEMHCYGEDFFGTENPNSKLDFYIPIKKKE